MQEAQIISLDEVKVNCDLYPKNKSAIIIGAFFHNVKVRVMSFLKLFLK